MNQIRSTAASAAIGGMKLVRRGLIAAPGEVRAKNFEIAQKLPAMAATGLD